LVADESVLQGSEFRLKNGTFRCKIEVFATVSEVEFPLETIGFQWGSLGASNGRISMGFHWTPGESSGSKK
jgi:hypothetical protein